MPDLVFYTNNVPALVDEAEAKGFKGWLAEDGIGGYTLGGDRTKLITKWPENIALLRIEDLTAASTINNMRVLGHYEGDTFVAVDQASQDIYNRMYPRTPINKEGFGGVPLTITPPARIGSFT